MNYLKRIELWVLLIIIGGGLFWVFSSKSDEGTFADVSADGQKSAQTSPLKYYRSSLKRDYGNARLDIDLWIRNDKSETINLHAPAVKLVTSKGKDIPSFFLPFDPIPQIASKAAQDVQLRYWVDAADLEGGLTFEVNGVSIPIKSEQPFDLKSIPNDDTKTFQPGKW